LEKNWVCLGNKKNVIGEVTEKEKKKILQHSICSLLFHFLQALNKMEDINLANNPLVHIDCDILEDSTMMMPFQISKALRIGQLTCSVYLHT
jgi:uncharacterized Rmd1/YagE family protein